MTTPIFLHIPKTGGTALRVLKAQNPDRFFPISDFHTLTLDESKSPVWFVIRDPLSRFCSGYWERYHTPDRKKEFLDRYPDRFPYEYGDWQQIEREVFERFPEPNALLSHIRNHGEPQWLSDFTVPLAQMLMPLTYWLGHFEIYKRNEHLVSEVVDLGNLTLYIKSKFGLEMPRDPFSRRSRRSQSRYDPEIDQENTRFFQEYRVQDYRLIEHITQQPYFWTDNN